MFITTRQYYMGCSMCGKTVELENNEVDKLIKSPIPWIYKYGWTTTVGLLFLYFLIMSIATM